MNKIKKISNAVGPAIIKVCCLNYKDPFHIHPHKLVGTNCAHGVASININIGEETEFE